jgi:FkbM family methyltransferase
MHEPVVALGAYMTGKSGGCGLIATLQAPHRLQKLQRSISMSEKGTKLVEETADGFSRWDTPLGPIWCPPKNSPAFAIGEQLAEVYTEGEMAVGPNDVVLDCGANIGDFVRVCLKAGVGKVVAIDPSPNNVEAMRRTFSQEIARGQVVLVPKGVWHEDSTMTMILYENTLLDSFVMRDRTENVGGSRPREIKLPVTTIDKIVEELKLEKVTFVKMDVEGAERNAIRGAAKTITRFRPRMSLATENLEDDYIVVPQEVRKIGQDYSVRCGLCQKIGLMAYKPDILFFTPYKPVSTIH